MKTDASHTALTPAQADLALRLHRLIASAQLLLHGCLEAERLLHSGEHDHQLPDCLSEVYSDAESVCTGAESVESQARRLGCVTEPGKCWEPGEEWGR